ncbi:MAG: hypothetical protein PF518_16660 [Spirochaetaceae bacterium]|jgi:hypothetical protein|nr:hypothetical protein [Spirochaetaceae bacterium]
MNVIFGSKAVFRNHIRKIVFILMVVLFIQPLSARGTQEVDLEYKATLFKAYDRLIFEVERGDLSAGEAKEQLSEIRKRYGKGYNDDAGIMEAHIDAIAEKRMTAEEALNYATLLQEKKYMEFRREENRNQEETKEENEQGSDKSKQNDKGKQNDGTTGRNS